MVLTWPGGIESPQRTHFTGSLVDTVDPISTGILSSSIFPITCSDNTIDIIDMVEMVFKGFDEW
jgi:hypothetical protein